jgi:hypothetical protein
MQTFWNTLSVPSSYLSNFEDGTECSETLAYKIQTPGSSPEESTQHPEHGESLKSRKHLKSSGFRFSGAFIILGLLDSWRWRHYIPSKLHTQRRSATCPRWLESSVTLLWKPQIVHLNNFLLLLFLFLLLSRVKWATDRLNCLHTSQECVSSYLICVLWRG